MPEIQLTGVGFPIDFNDQLVVSGITQVANTGIRISVRTLLPTGQLQVHQTDVVATGSGTSNTWRMPLDSGYLLGVELRLLSAPTTEADSFYTMSVQRGAVAGSAQYWRLTSGYLGVGYALSWPDDKPQRPFDFIGVPHAFTVTNPTAGQNWNTNVPAGTELYFQSMRFRLVADANAADRRVEIQFRHGANIYFQKKAANVQTAGQTRDYVFSGFNQDDSLVSGVEFVGVPQMWLDSGNGINIITENIRAGDAFTLIVVQGLRRVTTG